MLPSSMTTSSNPISPKNSCSLSLNMMMLYMKFDYIWPTDIKDVLLESVNRQPMDGLMD